MKFWKGEVTLTHILNMMKIEEDKMKGLTEINELRRNRALLQEEVEELR